MLTTCPQYRSEVAEELDERGEQLVSPVGDRVTGGLGEVCQAVRVGEHPEAEEDNDGREHALVHEVGSCRGEGSTDLPLVTRVAAGSTGWRAASAAIGPARGVLPQDPAGFLVPRVRRGGARRRCAVVPAGYGVGRRGAEDDRAGGVLGAGEGPRLERCDELAEPTEERRGLATGIGEVYRHRARGGG